jgi:hypothetical protein
MDSRRFLQMTRKIKNLLYQLLGMADTEEEIDPKTTLESHSEILPFKPRGYRELLVRARISDDGGNETGNAQRSA